MSNTYFQFKEFIIHQDKAALKVCTDACCFGALMAPQTLHAQKILDLGTGTGLLSLMLAQMNHADITGIDIHLPSVEQAQSNFDLSKWSNRLTALHADIRLFSGGYKFDWIICNPPFFENSLKSPKAQKELSKHIDEDGWNDWIEAIERNLSEDGTAAILIPFEATEKVKAAFVKAAFYCVEEIHLYHAASKSPFRNVLKWKRGLVSPPTPKTFFIKNEDQSYTDEFKQKLSPYYLHL